MMYYRFAVLRSPVVHNNAGCRAFNRYGARTDDGGFEAALARGEVIASVRRPLDLRLCAYCFSAAGMRRLEAS
jgi:hypothetical protein